MTEEFPPDVSESFSFKHFTVGSSPSCLKVQVSRELINNDRTNRHTVVPMYGVQVFACDAGRSDEFCEKLKHSAPDVARQLTANVQRGLLAV